MMAQQTLDQLYELRLTGMAEALEEQMRLSDISSLAFEERFALLLEREITVRDDRRLTRLLRTAKLAIQAAVEDIDFRSPRGLDRSVMLPSSPSIPFPESRSVRPRSWPAVLPSGYERSDVRSKCTPSRFRLSR